MNAAYESAFAHTFDAERGFSNNSHDSGGATRFGITEAVARAHGYKGKMTELPLPLAKSILKESYWDALRLDGVALLSYPIAEELFDTGVNMGIITSGKFLQRILNVLNREQEDYSDLVVDGLVGKVTVFALDRFLKMRGKEGESVILRALNSLQGARYIEIAEAKPTQETFEFGWLSKRVT